MMKFIGYILVITAFLLSCSKDLEELNKNLNIGDDFVDTDATLAIVDTFRIECSTVKMDSIITSGTNRALVGKYFDPSIGKVSAESYLKMQVAGLSSKEGFDQMDSLVLYLISDTYYYGDTMNYQTISVHRLTEKIEYEEDCSYFYNTSSFKYDLTPIGEYSFIPKPIEKDTLAIQMSSLFANELFQMYLNSSETIESQNQFENWFKGLCLVPNDDNTCVMGYSLENSSLFMRLFYHDNDYPDDKNYIQFNLSEYLMQFNNISTDYNSEIINLQNDSRAEIHESQTNELTYIQGGMGLYSKLKIPGLKYLLEKKDDIVIVQALLSLKPQNQSYNNTELAQEIVAYRTDEKNNFLEPVWSVSDESAQIATIQLDQEYNENTSYKFDLTNYIAAEFSDNFFSPENGLLVGISPTRISNSLDRVVLNGNIEEYEPQLTVFYMKK